MGCDIHGWVEVNRPYTDQDGKKQDNWDRAIDIKGFIGRDYDMFGLMFGVRNYCNFNPVADGRGFPKDADWSTKDDYEGWGADAHSASWVTYKEIKEIDWTERSTELDDRIHVYDAETGAYVSKYLDSSTLTKEIRQTLDERKEVVVGNEVLRLEEMTREQALSPSWQELFDMMGYLAKKHGDENVRMVVWFDN